MFKIYSHIGIIIVLTWHIFLTKGYLAYQWTVICLGFDLYSRYRSNPEFCAKNLEMDLYASSTCRTQITVFTNSCDQLSIALRYPFP